MMAGWAMRRLPQSAAEVAVATVVFAAGVLVGSGLQPTPSDWLGFAGALVGASITVAGSVYVLDRERRRGANEQRDLLVALLDEVDEACIPFQVANERALVERYSKTAKQQAGELKDSIARLHALKDEVKPSSVNMMKVVDAIAKLQLDPELDAQVAAAGLYPDSADFGALNEIGHDIRDMTGVIRGLLRDQRGA